MDALKDHLVDHRHPVLPIVVRVVNRIVNANEDLEFFKKQKWTVWVVHDDSFNAFVLPVSE